MAATHPSATCTPALRGAGCYGFLVASGDLHTLQAFGGAHAGVILDDGTAA